LGARSRQKGMKVRALVPVDDKRKERLCAFPQE
jgi:hypothetical protein